MNIDKLLSIIWLRYKIAEADGNSTEQLVMAEVIEKLERLKTFEDVCEEYLS